MLILANSCGLSNLLLLPLAISTNRFDIVCTTSTPSSDRSAYTFHSNRFFSGWNCTAKKGYFFAYIAVTKSTLSPCEVALAVMFQNPFSF